MVSFTFTSSELTVQQLSVLDDRRDQKRLRQRQQQEAKEKSFRFDIIGDGFIPTHEKSVRLVFKGGCVGYTSEVRLKRILQLANLGMVGLKDLPNEEVNLVLNLEELVNRPKPIVEFLLNQVQGTELAPIFQTRLNPVSNRKRSGVARRQAGNS